MGGKCRYSRLCLIDQFDSKIASKRVEKIDLAGGKSSTILKLGRIGLKQGESEDFRQSLEIKASRRLATFFDFVHRLEKMSIGDN